MALTTEIGIYYSDNGMIWKASKTELTYQTTGVNLQEPVVTDLGNGTLRLFVRTGNGFLYCSDSFDNGETWETDLHPTSFPAVFSAFNVERDRETGYLWMAWEYNCENDHGQIQMPRTRVGVAVSFDQGKNWSYVATLTSTTRTPARLPFQHRYECDLRSYFRYRHQGSSQEWRYRKPESGHPLRKG